MKRSELVRVLERTQSVLIPLLSVLLAFVIGSLIVLSQNRNPVVAYQALFRGAIGSVDGLGVTIGRAIPLALAGLAVTLAYRGGVFNIGAEGQLILGGICSTAVGISFPNLPAWLHVPLALAAGALGGAAWAFLPGYLKSKRGLNEVLTTLMMNYIALEFISYLVRGPLQGHPAGHPTTVLIADSAKLPIVWGQAQMSIAALITPLLALLAYVLMFKTSFGFGLRTVGANAEAARYAGIKVQKTVLSTMLMSGALAGLAGGMEILGVQYRLWEAFLQGYGFDAIPVALVGQLHPLGVLLTAFFFGMLRAGANSMQVLARVPMPLINIIQSLTILFALAGMAIRVAPRRQAESEPRQRAMAAGKPLVGSEER